MVEKLSTGLAYRAQAGAVPKFAPGVGLGDRQIRVVASDGGLDRDGDIVVASGIDLTQYRKNPICLFGHDHSKPIGTASTLITNGRLEATITFAPAGASVVADEIAALAKSNVLRAVSIGFRPISSEPIRTGRRYTAIELCEISVVSVGANFGALTIERAGSSFDAKGGRVLSGANESRLRQAHGHLTDAMEHVCAVLDEVEPDADDDADHELAAAAERRKRLAEIAALAEDPITRAARLDRERRHREVQVMLLTLAPSVI